MIFVFIRFFFVAAVLWALPNFVSDSEDHQAMDDIPVQLLKVVGEFVHIEFTLVFRRSNYTIFFCTAAAIWIGT